MTLTSHPAPISRRRRGFTLTEILVAMAIFALGGSAIVALFITNVRLSRQAMDQTRAAEITRNLRSLLTQSLSRPIVAGVEPVYRFEYPGSSLKFRPSEFIREFEQESRSTGVPNNYGGTPVENAIFFRLPKEKFDTRVSGANNRRQIVTSLPNDAVDINGAQRGWGGPAPDVFRLLPDTLRTYGAVRSMDEDDRIHYSFDIQIRRSVGRAGIEDPVVPNSKAPLSDLYVVHVKVYKSFQFTEETGVAVVNDPFYEWDFYVAAAR